MIKKILPVSGILIFVILSGTISDLSSVSMNLKSNLIVLSGTLLCCLISYPFKLFSDLYSSVCQAFSENRKDFNDTINQIVALSAVRRSGGVLELDKKSSKIENDFLKMGIEMVVDGYDRYTIFKTLERRYDNYLEKKRSEADLINTMVKYMPIFGFVGTIIGLINVLNHMGSPELIGKGVATALLTTFYGLLYANIVFLPIAKKLKEKIKLDSIELALIIEGVMDICEKVNPKAIGYRLRYCIGGFYQDDRNLNPGRQVSQKVLSSFKFGLKRR
ncbi:MAG: flagellar motor component [Desulfobacteraceae bacterium]|nr:flagellar motor component [Desulfobacteraceae bacterium]